MAWSLVAAGSTTAVASGNITVTVPSGSIQNGDLIVLCCAFRGTVVPGHPTAGGYTAVNATAAGDTDSTNGIAGAVMSYAIYQSGTTSLSPTFTRTGGDAGIAVAVVYRGGAASQTGFQTSQNQLASASATATTGSLTTTQANQLIVAMCSGGDNLNFSAFDAATDPTTASSGSVDTSTAPTAGTWIERVDNGTGLGADGSLCVADAIRATAGSTGTIQCTVSASAQHAMIAAAFFMAAAGTITEGEGAAAGTTGGTNASAPVLPTVGSGAGTTGGTNVSGATAGVITSCTATTGGSMETAHFVTATASASGTTGGTVETDPAPRYALEGTSTNSGASATCSPPWPVGYAVGDYAIMVAEYSSTSEPTLTTPGAFTLLHKSTYDNGAPGSNLSVWHCRVDSTSMTRPVIGAMSDHCHAKIVVIKNVYAGASTVSDQVDVSALTDSTTGTSQSAPGVTTTTNDCLVLAITSRDQDSSSALFTTVANSTLEADVEEYDSGTATGDGGGFRIVSGIMRTAGATGTIDSTTINSQKWAAVTVALRPLNYVAAGGTITEGEGAAAGTSTATGATADVVGTVGVAGRTQQRRKALVTALLKFNGSDESTTFTDEVGGTWTASNGAGGSTPCALDDTVTYFTGSTTTVRLNGNTDDAYLTKTYDSNWDLSTGDFTIDILLRPGSISAARCWFDLRPINGNQGIALLQPSADPSLIRFLAGDSDTTSFNVSLSAPTGSLAVDTWCWVSVDRKGNDFYLYINGKMVATTNNSVSIYVNGSNPILFGNRALTTDFAFGRCASFRVVKGEALYGGQDFETLSPGSGNFVYDYQQVGITGTLTGSEASATGSGAADGITVTLLPTTASASGTTGGTSVPVAYFAGAWSQACTSTVSASTNWVHGVPIGEDCESQTEVLMSSYNLTAYSLTCPAADSVVTASGLSTLGTAAGSTGGTCETQWEHLVPGTAAGTCSFSMEGVWHYLGTGSAAGATGGTNVSGSTNITIDSAAGTGVATGVATGYWTTAGTASGVASDVVASGKIAGTVGSAAGTSVVAGENANTGFESRDGAASGTGTATAVGAATIAAATGESCSASCTGASTQTNGVTFATDCTSTGEAVGNWFEPRDATDMGTCAVTSVGAAPTACHGESDGTCAVDGVRESFFVEAEGMCDGTSTSNDWATAMVLPTEHTLLDNAADVVEMNATAGADAVCDGLSADDMAMVKLLVSQAIADGVAEPQVYAGSNYLDTLQSGFFLFFP